MAGFSPPLVAPGPVEYKRKYTLWVLVVLLLFCWPAAILYYFTRDKVMVQELHTYAMPVQGAPPGAALACPRCGRPATWAAQYNRWYCSAEQQYI